jgi:hypothetical protein
MKFNHKEKSTAKALGVKNFDDLPEKMSIISMEFLHKAQESEGQATSVFMELMHEKLSYEEILYIAGVNSIAVLGKALGSFTENHFDQNH